MLLGGWPLTGGVGKGVTGQRGGRTGAQRLREGVEPGIVIPSGSSLVIPLLCLGITLAKLLVSVQGDLLLGQRLKEGKGI